jgi:uncharacterized protein (TIGR04255 family)
VEALVEFSITKLDVAKLPALESLGDLLGSDYPDKRRRAEADVPSRSVSAAEGFVFVSSDGKQIIQARVDGFSFSRLAPYDRWETFIHEARRTWQLYVRAVGDVEIRAFSLRFINELLIPVGIPLYNFFNIYPAMPDRATLFNGMFLFAQTDLHVLPGTLSVIMAPVAQAGEQVRIALDNTFRFRIRDESTVWENLETIRKVKNDTFEAQLTQQLRDTLK